MGNMFYSQSKLREYAEACRRLVCVYESREQSALALQLRETASVLERISESSQGDRLLGDNEKKQLFAYFRDWGISMNGMLVSEPFPGRMELVLHLSKKRGCMTAKELAEDIGGVLGRRLRPAPGSRQVVTKEQGEFILEEMTDYRLLFGHAGCNKGFSRVSGDNYSFVNTDGGRSIISLADGMGCGEEANAGSTRYIELLEQMLDAGFSEGASVEMLNAVFSDNDSQGMPVTLDLCSINEYEGTADFWKMGAAASFIKSRDKVHVVNSSSLPAGVIGSAAPAHQKYKLENGDYIIMMSDGVLDSLPFYDKEKRMQEIIGDIDERMPQAIAERILNEAYFYDEKIKDDMTVLVTGVWRMKPGERNVQKG